MCCFIQWAIQLVSKLVSLIHLYDQKKHSVGTMKAIDRCSYPGVCTSYSLYEYKNKQSSMAHSLNNTIKHLPMT